MNIIESAKERQTGVDLYKILCCFLITTIHLFGYSDFLSIKELTTANFIVAGIISSANIIGTSGFVFISGYYLSGKGTNVNLKRIMSFILEINFLSVFIFFISFLLKHNFSLSLVIHSFFPLLTQHFWYPFNYVVLLLLSPYLNLFIEKISKKELFCFILIIVSVSCGFLKLDIFYSSYVFLGHSSHSFLWWIILYITAAYYRRYGVNHPTLYGPVLFLTCIIIGFLIISAKRYNIMQNEVELLDDNSLLGLLATYSSFITFRRINIGFGHKLSSVMKYLVPATFVVYIFQEHNSIRNSLWSFVNVSKYAQAPFYKLIILILLLFIGLWILSVVIYLTYLLARKLYVDRICHLIEKIIKNIIHN